MATVLRCRNEGDGISEDVYAYINLAEDARRREYHAAVSIQSWFRGVKTRCYLKHLAECAIIIQAAYRGHRGRRLFREDLEKRVNDMINNAYHHYAVKIQKVWRGYITRKYKIDYYSRKKYLESLVMKNEIVSGDKQQNRDELRVISDMQKEQYLRDNEEDMRKKLEDWTSKHHYLVSTIQQPGVFNNPYNPQPDDMEYFLRRAKPRPQPKSKKEHILDPAALRYDLPALDPLPPVAKKPQGPFREPSEVQRQRYRPFKPSLHAESDYYSLEKARDKMKRDEWTERLFDDVMHHGPVQEAQYKRMLHASASYGDLPYGTAHFRHEYPDQWLMKKKGLQKDRSSYTAIR